MKDVPKKDVDKQDHDEREFRRIAGEARRKVLIIDADSQHSATVSLSVTEMDKLTDTLATVM